MIWVAPVALGIAAMLAVWRCWVVGERLAVALALAGVVVVGNLLWLFNVLDWLSLADLIVGAVALRAWHAGRARWAAMIAMLAYLRMALHAGLAVAGPEVVVLYIHALNALFAAQVAVVSFPGGVDECRDLLRRFGRRNLLHPVQRACRAEAAR